MAILALKMAILAYLRAILAHLGAILARLGANLDQLSVKFGPKMPPKQIFDEILTNFPMNSHLETLIFAIPYMVFEGFSILSIIASKMLSKSSLSSQNEPK